MTKPKPLPEIKRFRIHGAVVVNVATEIEAETRNLAVAKFCDGEYDLVKNKINSYLYSVTSIQEIYSDKKTGGEVCGK